MTMQYPTKATLWRGAILGGIVNALMAARNAFFAGFRYWSRNHYILNGMDGREGVVAFREGPRRPPGHLVGVFYDVHSPVRCDSDADLKRLFHGCPPEHQAIAEGEVLPYLRLESRGKVLERVTALFWDEGDNLTAADPWDVVLANGVNLIERELIEDLATALAAWQDDYQFSPEQLEFARSVFGRKLARPGENVELSLAETKWLASTFQDPRSRYAELQRHERDYQRQEKVQAQEGPRDQAWWDSLDPKAEAQKAMTASRELFAALGILVPPLESS